ncbi:NADH dehydrogenase [ubiquinone] iron-sulfur protein 6, mitochondrial-like isoform X2 [Pomacea canaliculata]|uniref:NADH dehydrogenase [ubiquinone] iron-sulfur protein 6, mitochondrial-like isoform X2 n=1 Tax=Pomacea canaliculata TaxID=400727 RepID=UPI000D73E544|nr:NADH dehydrogenase [ubiquinone] iron-sulfur protein 6, mitochondrial-like isoform X2 [Pomacea canaliculata]
MVSPVRGKAGVHSVRTAISHLQLLPEQKIWSKEDYRRFRFVGREKLVNPSFAVNIIAEDPVVVVDSNHVFSNSGGALGHPKVYINLDKPEGGVCGYSGKKFIQAKFYNTNQHGPSISYEEYLKQIQH